MKQFQISPIIQKGLKTIAAFSVALLTNSWATAVTTNPTDKTDSLKQELRTMEEDTLQVNLYIELGKQYLEIQIDSATLYFEKAYKLSKKANYASGIVVSRARLAGMESLYGNHKRAVIYSNQALRVAQQTSDSVLIYRAYQRLGLVYINQTHYSLSFRYHRRALAIAEKIKDSVLTANSLRDIGLIYDYTGEYSQAITMYKRALSLAQGLDSDMTLYLYNNIGVMNAKNRDYDSAKYYYEKAIREVDTLNYMKQRATIFNNAASLHTDLKQYTKALSYARRAQVIQQNILPRGKYDYYLEDTMGNIYVGLQQYRKARIHYNRALSMLTTRTQYNHYIAVFTNIIRLDSLEGNFQQALSHQQDLTNLKDSLADVEEAKAIGELKVQYETEQKDQEITLLQAQTDRQQLEAQQQRWVKNSFIAGSIGLFLLLGLGYNRYRFKQRALGTMQQQNEEIQAQKERVEQKNYENQLLLKEVHHRVKNNLQIVLSILNAQADSLRDPATVAALRESQHRVHSMALIHQSLYRSDNLSQIQAQHYLREMVETVCQSYRTASSPVRLQLHIEDLAMDMSTAVPVGLIVTELVTNACKHALGGPAPELSVSLRAETTTQYRLTVSDNGPGLPPDFDVHQSDSLGLQLVQGLAQQLDGELVVVPNSGARFELLFQQAA